MILTGVVGVSAANTLTSNGVLYSNTGSSVTTVEGALNELYANYNSLLAKGNASASEILFGKTSLVKGKEVTGTMPNNGSVSKALNAGGSYTIPKGYHDGTGKVTANTLASQTSATAVASNILSGKTAWVNGSKITGTMASLGAKTYTPGTSNQTIASGQYLSGTQTIKGDSNLISANIKSGVSIFGVSGNSNVVDTSAGDATAAQILSGKKAYVDGSLITGSMANKSGTTVSSTTVTESGENALITIPSNGYYSTSSKISVPIETIKNEVDSLMITPTSIAYSSKTANGYSWDCTYSVTVGEKYIVIYGGSAYNYNPTGYTVLANLSHSGTNGNTNLTIQYVQATSNVIKLGGYAGNVACLSLK